MHCLIALVNDNLVGNNLKKILVYVYFGLIVNWQTKNCWITSKQWSDSLCQLIWVNTVFLDLSVE